MFYFFTFLILCLLVCDAQAHWSSFLPTVRTPYSQSKFYYLHNSGINAEDGYLSAFVDIDKDKHTDIFFLSSNLDSFYSYLWNTEKNIYEKCITCESFVPHGRIVNLLFADLNQDGYLDVLAVCRDSESYITYPFVRQDSHDLMFYLDDSMIVRSSTEPILMHQASNSLFPYIFAMSESGPLFYHLHNGIAKVIAFRISNDRQMCPLSKLISPAFVDMNGDCQAELVVVCEGETHLEIWTSSENSNGDLYSFSRQVLLDPGARSLAFADINQDGAIDILYVTCFPGDCKQAMKINIVYNSQRPLCDSIKNDDHTLPCRKLDDLCSADRFYHFDKNSSVDLKELLGQDTMFLTHFDMASERVPTQIRVADVDLDGHIDVLLTMIQNKTSKVFLLKGRSCGSFCVAFEKDNRVDNFGVDHPLMAAFLDVGDNGKLDIVVQNRNSISQKMETHILLNNIATNAYFLKANIVHNNSTPIYGATYKLVLTDYHGRKRCISASQQCQTGHLALQTPYYIFGLGRTSTYIEQFITGIQATFRQWVCIIPNSQLTVTAFNQQKTLAWTMELYLNPSQYTFWVLVALLSTTAVLLLTVALFKYVENREDAKERKREAAQFNINAM